jgi:hypothetical protein
MVHLRSNVNEIEIKIYNQLFQIKLPRTTQEKAKYYIGWKTKNGRS